MTTGRVPIRSAGHRFSGVADNVLTASEQMALRDRIAATFPVQRFVTQPKVGTVGYYQDLAEALTEAQDPAGGVDDVGDDDANDVPFGTMVAFMLSTGEANALAVPGHEAAADLHVTLAYLGKELSEDDISLLNALVAAFSTTITPLTGVVGGQGLFLGGETPVTYASVDVPGLNAAREYLVEMLTAAGLPVSVEHGYTPHITLSYSDLGDYRVHPVALVFADITVAANNVRSTYPLGAAAEAAAAGPQRPPGAVAEDEIIKRNKQTPEGRGRHEFKPAVIEGPNGERCLLCGGDRPADGNTTCMPQDSTPDNVVQPAPATVPVMSRWTIPPAAISSTRSAPIERGFVNDINGRMLLTGPCRVTGHFEQSMTAHNHMLWMQGRLVGGEQANRNGAFWSTGDLEMGHPTVKYGPLNWLHQDRHIIGSLADANFVGAMESAANGDIAVPHIDAAAAIWTWLYPDESAVVQLASDAGQLWYSMECISEKVGCVGENGCGVEVSYADYCLNRNGACEHMVDKSAVRRLINPTFLGAAVIVPPTRPGWADANAHTMAQAAGLAERAFEDAGRPDIDANTWEHLMAQVVEFANSA